MRKFLTLGLGILVLVATGLSSAQITYEGCVDARGVPVASVANPSIRDVAMATIVGGQPVIFYNPYVLMNVPQNVKLFFYAHECGHHALGQVLGGRIGMGEEQQADCWGISTLVDQGLFNDDDVTLAQRALAALGVGDWTHLPGPQRAINLRACLRTDNFRLSKREHGVADECMNERIEGCVEDCTLNYGYPELQCRTTLCNPDVGPNRSWARQCR